jgi:hypothetical protein
MKAMGIPVGFDSTKGKPVKGNETGAARIKTKRTYRQVRALPLIPLCSLSRSAHLSCVWLVLVLAVYEPKTYVSGVLFLALALRSLLCALCC